MGKDSTTLAKAIAAHAESMRRQSVTVPEWENTTIWFDPLTCGDIDRLDNFKSPGEYNVQMLIYKAEDKDGKKLFSLADKHMLMSAPHNLINRLCLIIGASGYGRIDKKIEELGGALASPQGRRMFLKYSLAEKLGKTFAEIDAIPEAEFVGWLAYYEAKEKMKD